MNTIIRTLVLLCAFTLFGAPSVQAGIIGLYTFDDSGTRFNDSSGAGNHITGTAVSWQRYGTGKCMAPTPCGDPPPA